MFVISQAILSSRKEAYVSKHREKPHPVSAQRAAVTSSEGSTSPAQTTLTAVSPPQPTPRTSKGQKETLASPLAKEIAAFEEAAQQMLRRMNVMLVTVKGVGSEKDPGRRLEVLKILSVVWLNGLTAVQSLTRARDSYPLRSIEGSSR
jgi:hypothetical protein